MTETDANLAKASDAKLIGFNIRPNKEKELSNKYKSLLIILILFMP